jgi:CBS domain-containing protein
MANVISDRVAFFLKDFPPFSFLKEEEQAHIAEHVTVKFYRSGQVIFKEGEQGLGFCFVLHKGNVKLIKKVEHVDQLVDQCEPGDVFGVRSLLSGNPYVMSAFAEEETLVYAIPQGVFEQYLDSNQHFAKYFAAGYASGQVIVRADQNKSSSLSAVSSFEEESLQFSSEVVSCGVSTTIQEAAKIMKVKKVGSIIIAKANDQPIGIFLAPRKFPSDVSTILASQSLIRSAKELAEKPANTTECTAPTLAQASMAMAASGTIGM